VGGWRARRQSITRNLNDAVIQGSFDGGPLVLRALSFSVLSTEGGRWRPTWVDCSGAYLDFVGGLIHEAMILTRGAMADGQPVKQRMVWYDITRDELLWT